MRAIAAVLVLTGVAVPAAQAQIIDAAPTGPQVMADGPAAPTHDMLVIQADSIQMERMVSPLLTCPMPVSRGIVRDSSAVVRPREHTAPSRKSVAIPTQRANCVNPLFAER
jgi:hypothetical protein